MTREEHAQITQSLLGMVTAENQADASRLLTQLTDDYETTLSNSETLTTTNATLTANNEKLREVNADLFLKVGTSKGGKQDPPDDNGGNDIPELKYEDLFNEKGDLK